MPVNWGGQTIYISVVWGLIFAGTALLLCFIPVITAYKRLAEKIWACPNCGHRFKPKLYQMFTLHINNARMLRCPKCRKADWHSYSSYPIE